MKVFKIGDIATVIDNGEAYSSFKRIALDVFELSNWNDEQLPVMGCQYKIIGKSLYSNDEIIYAIEDLTGQYLIGERGINGVPAIIAITITINGKEAKLSDISEETLQKLREVK